MSKIAVIDGGTYYHFRGLYGDRYRPYFSEIIYILDLPSAPLDGFDAVVFPSRLHSGPLTGVSHRIKNYLDGGGMVVAFFAEAEAQQWLPAITYHARPTNFWWWKTPGANLGIYTPIPEHALFRHISIQDATWHYHGVFTPPCGATTLIEAAGGGAVLYEDTLSTPGRMLISSLDPFYHYGSYFMSAAECFLDGFLAWLNTCCGESKMKNGL